LTCNEDEDEEDELDNIPSHKKTKKGGYLKDGFVVDDSDEELSSEDISYEDMTESDDIDFKEEDILADIGSELSEEDYIE
jgi:hypothetical protein